jgi:transposase
MRNIEIDRAAVAALSSDGKTDSQIAKKLKRSLTFVRKWRKRSLDLKENLEDRPRAGRPKKIGPKVGAVLRGKFYGKVGVSTRSISKLLTSKGQPISRMTVSRWMKSQGWKPYKITKKFLLNQKMATARLNFAKKYGKLKEKDWARWLFTDEKKFVLYSPPNSQNLRVYCHSPEEVPSKFVPKNSPSIMVWGGISAAGLTELEFLPRNTTLNADRFQALILERAIPKINARKSTHGKPWVTTRLFRDPNSWVFLQDGAPPHKAKTTQAWLAKNVPDFVKYREWPGNSPDLNPIENVWAVLAEAVDRKGAKNLDELEQSIREEWKKFSVDFLKNLIFSMPRRLKSVEQANGWHTKY